MSYPGTFVTWKDESAIPSRQTVTELDNSPLFCALFTSDMGPEDWTTVVGEDFFNLYGSNISFAKHGQPLLQAAMQINNGAKLYCKRVVAEDSTYANVGVIANITPAVEGGKPVTDELDNPLYYEKNTATGEDLTTTTTNSKTHLDRGDDVDNTPVLTVAQAATVSYEKFSVEDASSFDDVYDKFSAEYSAVNHRYPLFVFVENGRGISTKAFKIVPKYELSKNSAYMVYALTIYVDGDEYGTYQFTFNPDYILNGKSFCLQQRVIDNTSQVKCKEYDSYINAFIADIAAAMSTDTKVYTADDIKNQDVLFGYTRKGTVLSDLVSYVDTETSINLSDDNEHIKLINGSTGSFGDYPISVKTKDGKDAYTKAFLDAFDEDKYPEVWDNENNKFIAIFDADYPLPVKKQIEKLAEWREDFLYFRDFGTVGAHTFTEIKTMFDGEDKDGDGQIDANTGVLTSRFVKPYPLYGDVLDPYTQKQITVSLTYLMAIKFISHYISGVNRPFCGIRYNVTFPEVIYGTLNFIPSETPKRKEKEQMVDARLNYCAYHNELLVMETDYTAQPEYTQWSFGNNVAATQSVVRAIRTLCPTTRYVLTTKAGLTEYESDINSKVIRNYSDWFDSLTFTYVGDDIALANKQYYGAISVKFTDFIQEEYFTVTALPSVSVTD